MADTNIDTYEGMKIVPLRKLAASRGIVGGARMNRDQAINALVADDYRKAQEGATLAPVVPITSAPTLAIERPATAARNPGAAAYAAVQPVEPMDAPKVGKSAPRTVKVEWTLPGGGTGRGNYASTEAAEKSMQKCMDEGSVTAWTYVTA